MARKRSSRKPPRTAGPSPADGDIVAGAYRKVMDREELTKAERQALKRHEKDKEEKLRWQFYHSIPQKHWREMSGRQTKVINEQAVRYGLPFGGPTIDLPEVVRAWHNFLADNAIKLAREDDALLLGASSPALERYREERALLARLDRLERERSLLPRDEVRRMLGRIGAILRDAGENLERQCGHEAAEILREALDDAERDLERYFDDEADPTDGASDSN